MRLYLGFDGAYVLSRYPLHISNAGEVPFLVASRKLSCVDIQPSEARAVLGKLKLKKFEVVELRVSARRAKAKAKK